MLEDENSDQSDTDQAEPIVSSPQASSDTKPKRIRLKAAKPAPKVATKKKIAPRRNPSSQPRAFPMFNLERSLSVSQAIKEKNAGNPWPPTEVAKALGYAERSSSVDIVLRSSNMYGLTTGTRNASHVTLEKNGRDIVYAPGAEAEQQAKQRAFLNVELFSKVLGYYKGNNLPETQFLSNTLVSEFSVPVEYHEEFRKLFDENCKYVGIGTVWPSQSSSANASQPPRIKKGNVPDVLAYASESNDDGKCALSLCPFRSAPAIDRRDFLMKCLIV